MPLTDREIASDQLLADMQWLLSEMQRLQGITRAEDPPSLGQHMDPKWTAVRRIAKGQTVGVSRRYLEAAVRDLTELASTRKLASWYALLLRAVREWDLSWKREWGGVFIGCGHPSKDRTIPCEFDCDGRPVENAELRAAIEGCLDQKPLTESE